MPVAEGAAKPQYDDKQKAEIFEKVCLMYETQRCTLASACETAGISDRTFFLWRGMFAEFADRYKKAREIQQQSYWENVIQPLKETALERLLKGEDAVEKKTKGERNPDGSYTVTEQTVTEKKILPNPTVTIFVAKGLNPEMFIDRQQIESRVNVVDDGWFRNLPLEKRLAILEIANAAGTDTPNPSAES